MSTERLEVRYQGATVGHLERAAGRITFTYSDAWRSRRDATPLSVGMPVQLREHPARVVEPFLWGLLPDNDAVLQRWGREFQVPTSHPFGLLAAVGEDLPGAMQIVHSERVAELASNQEHIDWLTDDDVAMLLRTVRRDQTAWLGGHSQGRWSLAGAQPKIALLHDGQRWGRPHGHIPTTHILKPAIAALNDHDLNEYLCLRAARRLGLRAAKTTIGSFGDERAVVVERYDRQRGSDGALVRVHQEDVCQALGVHPDRKYQSDGGPTPGDVARLLRAHLPRRLADAGVTAFASALAYNWIIAGPDAHAKNYALILSGSQVRLAPFYDIASALAYPDEYEPKIRLAMKIGGHYQLSRIGRNAWVRLASELRLDPQSLITQVVELADNTPDAFADVCRDPAVVELHSDLPGRLLDAVAARARRCAKQLRTLPPR